MEKPNYFKLGLENHLVIKRFYKEIAKLEEEKECNIANMTAEEKDLFEKLIEATKD